MSAIKEGECAYVLGSSPDANPYRLAFLPLSRIWLPINRVAEIRDLECQWDSGYAIAKRNRGSTHKEGETNGIHGTRQE
jgi:hypothetical protein